MANTFGEGNFHNSTNHWFDYDLLSFLHRYHFLSKMVYQGWYCVDRFYIIRLFNLIFMTSFQIQRFHYPLIVVVCHMIVKFLLALLFRTIYRVIMGVSRITLSYKENIRRISLPGIASSLDIGFSNWSFEFITISLYTMTKSTCIIFILAFALLFDLEKKRLSLIFVVSLISIGLFMFTYKSTQFQLNGFLLVLSASMLSGFRWTLSQKLMQRKESALAHPIDMMYHMQPWMILGLFPLAFFFELLPVINSFLITPENSLNEIKLKPSSIDEHLAFDSLWPTANLILIGSILAFLMEFSEYLLLTFTSSLTLSMAGIFKEIFTLYLAVNYNGDQMSLTNFIGLVVCLIGITMHVMLKVIDTYQVANSLTLTSPILHRNDEIEVKRLLDDDIVSFEFTQNQTTTIMEQSNINAKGQC
ncbi:Triose-phosphate Transporter-like protein [Sarcoptes scabiei]|uniref:Triose-phosphate Transporter-like protein n=1 Tax=Sarcoptes scabiei TaxID=52283 RepID=A0A132AFL0_SARSC|nr:Triose-phosphate Transporter-like protein [Sarcoptes scabiei]